ncbi:MAG: PocR ligand-binding domain-containing protein [Candidatus Promineifilaceae bacterium]
MSEFLTTTQVQELLQVDRTTVYRMLSDGRLSGVKIGNRWRFYKTKIDDLLTETSPTVEPASEVSFDVLPTTCLQGMQAVSAEAIGIGAIVTDAAGKPLTQMSNPCQFCKLIYESEKGQAKCLAHFSRVAHRTGSRFSKTTCHAGLECSGTPILINGKKTAVFIAGQYKSPNQLNHKQDIQQLADACDLDAAELTAAAAEIPMFDNDQQQKVADWLPKLTSILSEIGQERAELLDRLQRIAVMSAVC